MPNTLGQAKHASVVHMLADAADKAPNSEALVCGEDRLNYAQYLSAVSRFAHTLINDGLNGTRIAMLMRNSVDFCIAMFAVQLAGAQVVPLNPRYTKSELRNLLSDADVSALIHDEDNLARDKALAEELNIPVRISIGKDFRLTNLSGENGPLTYPAPTDYAELLFTGGTTGPSKGANIDHQKLITNLAQREALVPTRLDCERMLCVMPLYHCYAINMCLHNMVSCRGTLIIVEPFDPDIVLNTFAAEKITVFGGSPTLFNSLCAKASFDRADFSSLAITYSGASALSESMLNRWESATNSIVIEGYGQTEASPVISFNPVDGPRKLGSVGVAVPNTEIEIVEVKDGNKVLPANTCGEIRIRGPQIMNGYRNRPTETAQAIREGWLYTGDIGELDEDGYLYIRGRKKEMMIVSGFNVYPAEVEAVLATHPAVVECAVVGRRDDRRGEVPVAYVVTAGGQPASESNLKAHCEENLARYKIPAAFELLDSLPKTTVGKIDKLALNELANPDNE
ncbi:MAG: AMP-binding protein [Pseudomonadota bacterium]